MELKKITKKQLKISHDTRKQLIRLVTCENVSVKFAHSQLGINYSTAKMIVRKYRQSGKITQFRRERERKLQEIASKEHNSFNQQNAEDNIPQSGKIQHFQGQQMKNIPFSSFFIPTQGLNPHLEFMNISSQFYGMPTFVWGYPAQDYFSF